MAKKKSRRSSKGAIHKIGKITFLYFSGDVGDFIDALTSTLKDPKVQSQIGEALSQMGPAIEAMRAQEAAKAARRGSRRGRGPGGEPS